MLRSATQWLFLGALAFLAPLPAHAATFDLIYADSIDVVTGPATSGFSYGNDIALIVNKGPTNIGEAELSGATFTVSTSDPAVDAMASILNAEQVTPILPNEAVGTLTPGSPLPALLLPGETLRDVFPVGLFWLSAGFPVGYSGTVVIDITMTIGNDVAHYFILLNIRPGTEYSISVVHAGRVSSVPVPTATRASTWGAVKKLYR
jgi:hypothetical protein